MHVVYADSVQQDIDNPYGRGNAEPLSCSHGCRARWPTSILPNLYGEHGRPAYNSFVATFCHEIAHGRTPRVTEDRPVPLLHAQAAAQALVDAALEAGDRVVRVPGEPHVISEVLADARGVRCPVPARGELPDLSTPFEVDLFNTYRSYLFPQQFPISPPVHRDPRGDLVETVRAHGGSGQALRVDHAARVTRGGTTTICTRWSGSSWSRVRRRSRCADSCTTTSSRSGSPVTQPSFVDMPTLWVHHLRNVGAGELVTVFWADQLLDAERPDQYPEKVTP